MVLGRTILLCASEQALDIAHASFHQKGAEQRRWRALVQTNSLVGLVQHAAGDLPAATTSCDAAQASTSVCKSAGSHGAGDDLVVWWHWACPHRAAGRVSAGAGRPC